MKKVICFSFSLLLILFSCKKEKEVPTATNKIQFGNTTADSVGYRNIIVKTSLTSTGGNEITQHGHCWSNSPEPTIEANKTSLGKISEPKDFESDISGLTDNTTYYIRAYFTYGNGTVYNDEINIKTIKTGTPHVTTDNISDLTLYSATCGGTVVNDSGYAVTARGVCWDTETNPIIDNCDGKTNDGEGLGEFNSEIKELDEGTEYFLRAYATNKNGTGYGEERQFSTIPINLPTVETAEVTDITINSANCGGNVINEGNGNVYQKGICWGLEASLTLENCIDSTNNGSGTGIFNSNITNLNDNTQYYVVAFAINEKGVGYGEIKSFNTLELFFPKVETADVMDITYNSAKCGGNVTDNGNGNVSVRGVCWNKTGNPTLDNCEGYTEDGTGLGNYTSEINGLMDNTMYYIIAYATNKKGTGYGNAKSFKTHEALPIVETLEVSDIGYNTAVCGGNITENYGYAIISRGVCWNTSGNPTLDNCDDFTTNGSGMGEFLSIITGLSDNMNYYVTAYATNEKGTGYGNERSFQTLDDPCDGETTITYEGQTYEIIIIGDQCWMAENINVGQRIDGNQEMQNNSTIEKYCYDDNESNCNEYGGLYQWDEMMQYITQEGTQGICPDGWHIPTDEEWKILEGNVDSQYGVGSSEWDKEGWRGDDAGYKLKSETGWNSGGNGSDEFDFTALPGGYRSDDGYFGNMDGYATFWSTSECSASSAWRRALHYNTDEISRYDSSKDHGRSVRCLRD